MAGTRGKTKNAIPTKRRTARARSAPRTIVLVATRKGAWILHGDTARRTWRTDGPHFLGHTVSHLVLDPRDGETLLAAAKTGHLGPTVFRSTDLGRTWKEAAKPPAFAKAKEGETGRSGQTLAISALRPARARGRLRLSSRGASRVNRRYLSAARAQFARSREKR